MNAASPVRAMTLSSTAKKQFLRKGEGKGFRSSSKAYRETVSDEAISSQERLKLLEKMQQDHLQKLEQKMQQSREWQQKKRQLSKPKEKELRTAQLQAKSSLAEQPKCTNGCITETCIIEQNIDRAHEGTPQSLEGNDTTKFRSSLSVDSRVEPFTVGDDEKLQVQRLKRRLEIALREAERERLTAQRWSESQRSAIDKWVADQKATIEREMHKAENAALLIEKANRSLSAAEFMQQKEKGEVHALKATIEKLKLEKSRQEQNSENNEKLLKERIKRQSIRINRLEEQLQRCSTAAESNALEKSPLKKETKKSNTIATKSGESKLGGGHATCHNGHARDVRSTRNRPIHLLHQERDPPEGEDLLKDVDVCDRVLESDPFFKVLSFSNGDTESVLKDGTTIYHYAEIATTQTTYPDGLQVFEFPNGQVEKHYACGRKEIVYPDSTQKTIYSNGATEVLFPDGLRCCTKSIDGFSQIEIELMK